jgi:hypothetical protein
MSRLSLGAWIKGILGGAGAGFMLAVCLLMMIGDRIVRRASFDHPVAFEQAQSRNYGAILLAATAVCAFIGPLVIASPLGIWVRPAVYGAVGSGALVVLVALIVAYLRNEFPAVQSNTAPTTSIDFSRTIALPIALVLGSSLGLLVAALRRR